MKISRRSLLGGATALGATHTFWNSKQLWAQPNVAKRIIFFYFPDGVVGTSSSGSQSLWHPSGSEMSFTLPEQLSPLLPFQNQCTFLKGISTAVHGSAGGHPDGAMRLLTAAKNAAHESIDQYLARTVGGSAPWRHLYLGVQSNKGPTTVGKHLSYTTPTNSVPPQDDPRVAFCDLFSQPYDGISECEDMRNTQKKSIDSAMVELNSLRSQLGSLESQKLDRHLEALQELQYRNETLSSTIAQAQCEEKNLSVGNLGSTLYDPSLYPDTLKAQIDLMILGMECGLTNVGVLQNSHHTSGLPMNRFAETAMYNPSNDIPSHEASHYGANHDANNPYYAAFLQQRIWWVEQFSYLLESLDTRLEGNGTMLDNSIVVLCSEVSDGNTHSFDNMPFIIAGGGGGMISGGRLLSYEKEPHANLWISLARAMGDDLNSFGEDGTGLLEGFLSL